jgi:K+-transporting ATPase ATPase C chain
MTLLLRPCLTIFVLLTLLTGAVYPAVVTLIAQTVFPFRANGSVITRDGKAVGSELIGQTFDDAKYFWGRPSATTKDDKDFPYNAASSGASNLGPTNPALLDAVKDRAKALAEKHPDQKEAPLADLVTASASGLDPHISPAAAEYQVTRVAKARGLSADAVRQLVAAHTEGRTFGLLGEPRVNVLKLNLALDGK